MSYVFGLASGVRHSDDRFNCSLFHNPLRGNFIRQEVFPMVAAPSVRFDNVAAVRERRRAAR